MVTVVVLLIVRLEVLLVVVSMFLVVMVDMLLLCDVRGIAHGDVGGFGCDALSDDSLCNGNAADGGNDGGSEW